ncbi:hypothetical protein C4572_01895 [Candidatus Parcubacteria bacterium]|nr:MAG: hypothetical protein C4572_01895 [Candidatus Parcubacteria bacterium]
MDNNRKIKKSIKQLITGFVFITSVVIFYSPVFSLITNAQDNPGGLPGPWIPQSGIQEIMNAVNVFDPITGDYTGEIKQNTFWKNIFDEAQKAAKHAWAVAYKQGLSYFLHNLAYDTATWIASGGEGEKPMFITEGWGKYLADAADRAAGVFIDDFAREAWNEDFATFLCEPDFDLKVAITMGLEKTYRRTLRPRCTLSELLNNWDNEINNPDFLQNFAKSFDPYGSDLGIALSAHSSFIQNIINESEINKLTRTQDEGLLDVFDPITGKVETPAKAWFTTWDKAIGVSSDTETTPTGDAVADAINTFANTLIAKLFQNIWDGLWSPSDSGSGRLGSLENPEGSAKKGDRQAAEARFADLREVGRKEGGPYEVLQKLVICQDENNPGPTDCVITEKFRQAIEREMTVEEAIASGYLDGDAPFGFTPQGFEPSYKEGYPYRSILILRKYRIVPVGWEIAAEYIDKFEGDKTYGLNDLISQFENTSSNFYGLIDPHWVLKAPDYYCGLEGYGPVLSESVLNGQRSVNRFTYCADEKSCIKESEDSCQYFGYCTKEKRIWDLNGEECPDYYNTCTTFTEPASSQTFSYLKNTLEYKNCNADNSGCLWYCNEYNPIDNIWACDSQNERVKKICESRGVCSISQSSCIKDSDCPANQTCENSGCQMTASCSIAEGDDSCVSGDLVLNYSCPNDGDGIDEPCQLSESCIIPYGGISCTVSGCDSSQSLVSNYSFEQASTIIIDIAEDWHGDRNYFSRVTGSSEKQYEGNYAVRFYSPGGSGVVRSESMTVTLETAVSKDFTLSGWIYNNLVLGTATLQVVQMPSGNVLCNTSNADPKGEWVNRGCNFNLTSTATVAVRLVVSPDQYGNGPVGTVWFDSINLQEECLSESIQLALSGTVEKNESKLYLDGDVQPCDSANAGCSRFISLSPGTNIVYNGSFETEFEESWQTNNLAAVLSSDQKYGGSQSVSVVTAAGNSSLTQNIKFFKPNTEYVFSANVYIPEATTLSGDWFLRPQVSGCNWSALGITGEDNDFCYYKYDANYERYILPTVEELSRNTHLFNNSTRKDGWQKISLRIKTLNQVDGAGLAELVGSSVFGGENFYLDGIQIIEGTVYPEYSEYGSSNIVNLKKPPQYLNCAGNPADDPDECSNYAYVCTKDEVGCELYTPADGDPAIPGIANAMDFCPAECSGYQSFKQTATNFEEEKLDVYIIPSSATSCSAQSVGCEEFTNLDELARGGEEKDYYQYIRSCIKPNPTECATFYTWYGTDEAGYQLRTYSLQKNGDLPLEVGSPRTDLGSCENAKDALENPYCKEFYSQDGSISYVILQNTVSCTDSCYPYRITDMDSTDSIDPSLADALQLCENDTGAALPGLEGHWINQAGQSTCYFCAKYGGQFQDPRTDIFGDETCIYSIVPDEGVQCSGQSAGCREYKGNASANIKIAFYDNFEDGESSGWLFGDISNESTFVSGHSLLTAVDGNNSVITTYNQDLGAPCGPGVSGWNEETGYCELEQCAARADERYCSSLSSQISPNGTYILEFWAKRDGAAEENVEARLSWDGGANSKSFGLVNIGPEWNKYILGPVYLDETGEGIYLEIGKTAATYLPVYFDEVTIKKTSQNIYLIKDSWNIPVSCDTNPLLDTAEFPVPNAYQYMLGCEQYRTTDNATVYLKSFSNICRETAVNCEGLIDTHNSLSYFQETYNEGYTDSDIVVPEDDIVYLVNSRTKQCGAENIGCQEMALPTLDPDSGAAESYSNYYLINNPDQYSSILCNQEEVGCQEYQSETGSDYFKDPQNRICVFKKVSDQQIYGWYKKGTNSGPPDCPLEDSALGIEKPARSCQGGPRTGLDCLDDSQCPLGRCLNWAGECPREEDSCTEFIDPLSRIAENSVYNGGFEQDVDENLVPDGWEGAGEYSRSAGDKGTAAIKLIAGNLTQTLAIRQNTLYTISAKIKKSETGQNAVLRVFDADFSLTSPDSSMTAGTNSAEAVIPENFLSTGEYREFSGRFFSGNATKITITLGSLAGVDGHWIDDAAIFESGIYYYLNNTLDNRGCNGLVDYEKGCVLFNNRGNINYNIGENDSSYLIFNADLSPTDQGVGSTECVNFCNSDELLKVRQDRICGEWLNCGSTIKSVNENGVEEDFCLDLNRCVSLDVNGNCDYIIPGEDRVNQTYMASNPEPLKNMSGYSKAGIQWDSARTIDGYYYYSQMPQRGELSSVPNGNFEFYYDTGQPVGWVNPDGAWNENQFRVISDVVFASQKEGITIKEGESILKLGSEFIASSELFDVFPETEYFISADINTLNLKPQDASARVEVWYIDPFLGAARYDGMDLNLQAGKNWQTVSGSFNGLPGNQIYLVLRNEAAGQIEGSSYLDNIFIKPVLQKQYVDKDRDGSADNDNFVAPSCRLYPENDSLSCDYYDDSGMRYRGISGYCLLTDPKNPNVCLQWWPVDLIKGDTFGSYQAGYNDRIPLYYCLQAESSEEESDFTYFTGNVPPNSEGTQLMMFEFTPYAVDRVTLAGVPLAEFSGNDGGHDSGDTNLRFWVGKELDDNGDVIWSNVICASPARPSGGACGSGSQLYFDIAWVKNQPGWEDTTWIKYWAIQAWGTGAGCPGGDGWDDFGGYIGYSLNNCFKYLESECTMVGQTVTGTGTNKGWAGRVSQGSGYEVPDLEYDYLTDYKPFGSIVPPDPVDNPFLWSGDAENSIPLQIESPDTVNFSAPYQARGGTPYSCTGDWDCFDAAERIATPVSADTPSTLSEGIELVKRLFAKSYGLWSWNGDNYATSYLQECVAGTNLGLSCTQDSQCPSAFGNCLSGGEPYCPDNTPCNPGAANQCPLYGECLGNTDGEGYCLTSPAGGGSRNFCDPPTVTCPVGETCYDVGVCILANDGNYCLTDSDCLEYQGCGTVCDSTSGNKAGDFCQTDSDCVDDGQCGYFEGWNVPEVLCQNNSRPAYPNDYCGVAPVINGIKINNLQTSIQIDGTSQVKLNFNAIVDANQLPITSYRVDWGDGNEISVSGTSLRDQTHPENPFTLAHVYNFWETLAKNQDDDNIWCWTENRPTAAQGWPDWLITGDPPEDSCYALVKIQVTDNWGWCNGNIDAITDLPVDLWGYHEHLCQNNNNGWTYYDGVVEIRQR